MDLGARECEKEKNCRRPFKERVAALTATVARRAAVAEKRESE